MGDEQNYEITVKPGITVDPLELALWIRSAGYKCADEFALYIAKCMINGETWRPPVSAICVDNNPYCEIRK